MKTLCSALGVSLAFFLGVCGVPAVAGSGADFPGRALISVEDADVWSVGGAIERLHRGSRQRAYGIEEQFEAVMTYAFISCDVLPFLTLTAGGGQNEVKPVPLAGFQGAEPMWLIGATANLLEHELTQPTFLASICRVYASTEYRSLEGNVNHSDFDWNEWRSALMVSAEVIVEPGAEKVPCPYSAVFSCGLLYSAMEIPEPWGGGRWMPGAKVEESESVGYRIGLDVKLSRTFSVGYEALILDEASHGVNVSLHF
jgi:hypothetical protein